VTSRGEPVRNERVTIDYRGQGGGRVGSWLTDADGRIPEQTISKGYYDQAGGNTLYSYEPFVLRIGSSEYEAVFYINDPIDWEIAIGRGGGFSLLALFLFSFGLSLLLWFRGSVVPGALSTIGWFLTSQCWIYENQDMASMGLFWIGLGVLNLVLTFMASWSYLSEREGRLRAL